ncbi:MAG: hypothetical protein L6R41_004046 [Letrouitia leprolyta]|nr:MAG: hypothetical protein L6R41_004046 [Letrouitia leprolyta]
MLTPKPTQAAPSVKITTYRTDVTDPAAFTQILEKAVAELGNPEVVIYNAARINLPAPPFAHSAYSDTDVVTDFSIPRLGLRTTAQVLLPALRASASGGAVHAALWVTCGAIIHNPIPMLWSLCMAKSAQVSLVKSIAKEEGGKVHVALLTIGGQVSMEEKVNNPPVIAESLLKLWGQGKEQWVLEMKHGW